jgi:fucose 4-O-acetylase-like acetyltransferase
VALGVFGAALALGAYAASYLPSIYAQASFWTSSPTFFFLRVGILMLALPAAYAWNAVWQTLPRRRAQQREGGPPLQYFGRASLFIYWIHVEMVYGVVSGAIHRQLSFGQAVAAYLLFSVFLFLVAKAKDRLVGMRAPRAPRPIQPDHC